MTNRWISDLHWRRAGQQTRSEKTQNALLNAAETLILERGTKGTSVADIAALAGCSIGSVYHHFKDKEALYYALFHRMTSEFDVYARELIAPARWTGASILDILRTYVELALNPHEERDSYKAAAKLVAVDYPELQAHYAEIQAIANHGLKDLWLARAEEITHPDPERAIEFLIEQVSASLQQRLSCQPGNPDTKQVADMQFIDETLRLASVYLGLKQTTPETIRTGSMC